MAGSNRMASDGFNKRSGFPPGGHLTQVPVPRLPPPHYVLSKEEPNQMASDGFSNKSGLPPGGHLIQSPVLRPPPPLNILPKEEPGIQHVEIQKLLDDNKMLFRDRQVLQRELDLAKDEIHHMKAIISEIQAGHEMHSRELIENGLRLETELLATLPLKNEVVQLRAEIQRLNKIQQDRDAQVQSLLKDQEKLRTENQQIPLLTANNNGLQQELMNARAALDNEKKAKIGLMEQRQVMEKNLISMARDVEKLRAQLTSAGSRPWNAGVPLAYGMQPSSMQGGNPATYGNPFGPHLGAANSAPLYGPGTASLGGKEKPPGAP